MKEAEILELLISLSANEISLAECHNRIVAVLNGAKSLQLEDEPRNIQVKLDAKYDANSGVLFNVKISMSQLKRIEKILDEGIEM
jgi:hypothetical protein